MNYITILPTADDRWIVVEMEEYKEDEYRIAHSGRPISLKVDATIAAIAEAKKKGMEVR